MNGKICIASIDGFGWIWEDTPVLASGVVEE